MLVYFVYGKCCCVYTSFSSFMFFFFHGRARYWRTIASYQRGDFAVLICAYTCYVIAGLPTKTPHRHFLNAGKRLLGLSYQSIKGGLIGVEYDRRTVSCSMRAFLILILFVVVFVLCMLHPTTGA